jgi:arabinose-5-phosphate isomerase
MSGAMTKNPKTITAQSLATQAVHLMEQYRITALPVTNERGTLIGALNVHDLLRAGVV